MTDLNSKLVKRIPEVAQVRFELARIQRERTLLHKLLKLAERKTAIDRLNAQAAREVSHD